MIVRYEGIISRMGITTGAIEYFTTQRRSVKKGLVFFVYRKRILKITLSKEKTHGTSNRK